MGEKELRTALQHEGEAHARGFWEQAEAVVEGRRKEIETELEHLHDETRRSLQAEEAALRNNLLFEAQARATEVKLYAEAAMELRLLEIADRVLGEMIGGSRQGLWQALYRELPEFQWTSVKVHPEDLELARRAFPSAAIDIDEAIAGGLIVTNAEGTIRVDNSLSCRLMRAWPDLLPDLIKDLREQVDRNATACNDTTG
jgi:V/A-type H+-transporting ATPase subunit E